MSIDTDRFRTELLKERERVQNAIDNLRESHPGSLNGESEESTGTSDNHLGDSATAALGREIDHTLGENSEQILGEINGALERIEQGTYGTCTACGGEIGEGRLDAYPWGALCIDDARKAERR